MKVATFNINNINKRLDNLLAWLAKAEPDVVSLQELKAEQEAFPVLGASLYMGYFAQQSLDVLNPDLTVIEQLQQDFPQDGLGSLRNLAGAFQFSGEDVDKKIRALSGGDNCGWVESRLCSRCVCTRLRSNPWHPST